MSVLDLHIQNEYVSCDVHERKDGRLDIQGSVINPSSYQQMELVAPNSYMKMANYSGSGLPYPCAAVAFENTPNWMQIPISGEFRAVFSYPNSYYAADTYTKVLPSIFIVLTKPNVDPIYVQIKLPDPLELRTLTYREGRTGPNFYFEKRDIIGVQSQEAILRTIGKVKEQYNVA
jgi:hypothetical protein